METNRSSRQEISKDIAELSNSINELKIIDIYVWLPRGSGSRGGRDWEFWISRCKLLYLEWINNKVPLYSTGNYIQYPVINHDGKEYICIYLNHFAVQQKLTQHCKSTILQKNKLKKIDIYGLLHPTTEEYTFFSGSHETFTKIDHILCHKTYLNKFKKQIRLQSNETRNK